VHLGCRRHWPQCPWHWPGLGALQISFSFLKPISSPATGLSKAEWCVDCLWFMHLNTPWDYSKGIPQSWASNSGRSRNYCIGLSGPMTRRIQNSTYVGGCMNTCMRERETQTQGSPQAFLTRRSARPTVPRPPWGTQAKKFIWPRITSNPHPLAIICL
jgi:hypothetical protein